MATKNYTSYGDLSCWCSPIELLLQLTGCFLFQAAPHAATLCRQEVGCRLSLVPVPCMRSMHGHPISMHDPWIRCCDTNAMGSLANLCLMWGHAFPPRCASLHTRGPSFMFESPGAPLCTPGLVAFNGSLAHHLIFTSHPLSCRSHY